MPLGMDIGLGLGDIVLNGDPAVRPPPKKKGGTTPQFSANVYCGQTTRWIKIPLGREIGLGSGNIVLHGIGNLAPPKGAQLPPSILGPCLL